MNKVFYTTLALLTIVVLFATVAPGVGAAGPQWVTVQWGDTLFSIATRYGTTVAAMLRANGLANPNFVYAGQRLVVPALNSAPALASAPAANPAPAARNGSAYTVRAGDTLYSIATRYGTTVDAIMRANGWTTPSFIYTGQRLIIPGAVSSANPAPNTAPAAAPVAAPVVNPPSAGRWIDINISKQTITAYEGAAPVKTVLVSTGVSWFPTPTGQFKVYRKITSQTMSGGAGAGYYYLPNVPWVMYFTGAYSIHGTYWHKNFGHPMSHGCVNLTIDDAKWFFDWAEMGTPVISHH
jgi:LysM repeat protein